MTPAAAEQPPVQRSAPRRERARAATIEEIKQTALGLIRRNGTADVRFTDIARAMEMTAPALYRYFADRDELLNALIVDAYDDLGSAVAAAQDAVTTGDIAERWLAVARAYREWANREPQQFALIFGLPLPGYAAPEAGPTTEAGRRTLGQLSVVFVEAQAAGLLRPPTLRDVDDAMAVCVMAKNDDMDIELAPETFQAMVHAWASLHGFASLEAYGHLQWMDEQARDALFLRQVQLAAVSAGLPSPRG